MRILILIMFLSSLTFCQTIEDGWSGIKPLESTKKTVDKLFSDSSSERDGFYTYESSEVRLVVNYSTAPCEADSRARGQYDVAEQTVLNYFVYPNNSIPVSDLKLDPEFYQRQTFHPEFDVIYARDDYGVRIGATLRDGKEYVAMVTYRPGRVARMKFQCRPPTGITTEDGWRGIKPLSTNKAVVKKVLGEPEIDDNGYYRYTIGDNFVRVNYSTTPCTDDPYDRGQYKIPEGTVLDYYVRPKEFSLLSQLKFKKEKYYKDVSGDTNSILLINEEDGVIIGVQEQEGIEYLAGLDFRASKHLAEKFKCKEIEGVD